MHTFLFLFFQISFAFAEDYFFAIPSQVSLRLGATEIESYSASLNTGLTLNKNRVLGFSLENITLPDTTSDGTLSMSSASVSLSTDPLADWSFFGAVDGWQSENAVSAYGARGGVTWMGGRWLWTVEYGLQLITFAELPTLIWSDKQSTISDNSVMVATDVQLMRSLSMRASYRIHRYNTPMEDYAEGLRTRFIAPEVLNIAGTLTHDEAEVSMTYSKRKWYTGLDFTTAVSSLDELRTNGWGLRLGCRLQKKWTLEIQGARYDSVNAEQKTNPLHAFNSGVTYSW